MLFNKGLPALSAISCCFARYVAGHAFHDSHDTQTQIRLGRGDQSVSPYPKDRLYTQHHIWFGPDPVNHTQTRVGLTTWPIAHVLHNEIDGGVILPDRGDWLEAGQSMGRFVGETDDESFEIIVPFTATFVKPNVDLDLDEMVIEPYGDHGFLAVLDRPPPANPPEGILFLNSVQYGEYVSR